MPEECLRAQPEHNPKAVDITGHVSLVPGKYPTLFVRFNATFRRRGEVMYFQDIPYYMLTLVRGERLCNFNILDIQQNIPCILKMDCC